MDILYLVQDCDTLIHLDLTGNGLQTGNFRHLMHLPVNLQSLSLSDNIVGTLLPLVCLLENSTKRNSLKSLNLSRNRISNKDLKELELLSTPLSFLDLSHNPFSTFKKIYELVHLCPTLKWIRLKGHKIPPAKAEELRYLMQEVDSCKLVVD
mgnify:FL=1